MIILKTNRINSFELNLLDKISKRCYKENEISTDFFKTRLDGCCLLTSRIVAEVVFVRAISKNTYLLKGERLCTLKYLGSMYNVLMEANGYVQKTYITENQIIDYSHPMFLFKG